MNFVIIIQYFVYLQHFVIVGLMCVLKVRFIRLRFIKSHCCFMPVFAPHNLMTSQLILMYRCVLFFYYLAFHCCVLSTDHTTRLQLISLSNNLAIIFLINKLFSLVYKNSEECFNLIFNLLSKKTKNNSKYSYLRSHNYFTLRFCI